MQRNLAQSLIQHGRVKTTLAKAKDIRPFVERLITLAVKVRRLSATGDGAGALRARRAIHRLLGDRSMIPAEHQETYDGFSDAARAKTIRMVSGRRYRTGEPKGRLAFTGETVTHRLIETVAPRFEERNGGYTRLINLADRRIGDASRTAMVQLLGDEEPPSSLTRPKKSARARRADARYSFAIKAAKVWSGKGAGGAQAVVESESEDVVDDAPADEDDQAPGDGETATDAPEDDGEK